MAEYDADVHGLMISRCSRHGGPYLGIFCPRCAVFTWPQEIVHGLKTYRPPAGASVVVVGGAGGNAHLSIGAGGAGGGGSGSRGALYVTCVGGGGSGGGGSGGYSRSPIT